MLLPAVAAPQTAPDFNREIRPILSDNCFTCHGPDDKQRMANLRLDTKEGAFTKVIIPGDSSKSLLYQRITASNKALRMPPASTGKALTEKQLDLIRRWVDGGAKWEMHWAYVPPKRPAVPGVKNVAWPRNDLDRFVLARLEREGLKPSPEADKITLLRRLTFDLTGLPPSPAEIRAFVADKSPEAYAKQVERLLASPHYGERMAMQWLDLARYADTHGYHIDSHRDMWLWRDWVVNAFNRNLSFDRFTMEQLAGDLLPGATREQKIATGFSRNHMINFEGGAIPEEYQTEYVVDRVETTSTVWMGMTMGCARCHDHKYDPVKQREFYGFYAFFNTIPEKGLDGRTGNAEPMLPLPGEIEKQRMDEVTQAITSKEKALAAKEVVAAQEEWEKTRFTTLAQPSREGLLAHWEFDGNLVDTSGAYQHGKAARGEVLFNPGQIGRSAEFNGETHAVLPVTASGAFSLAVWVRYSGTKEMSVLQRLDEGRRGWELTFGDSELVPPMKRGAHLHFRIIDKWPDAALDIKTRERLIQNEWQHVVVNWNGSGKANGLKLFVNGKPVEVDVARDSLTGPVEATVPVEIGAKKFGNPYKGRVDDLRLYSRLLSSEEIESLAIHDPVRWLLSDTVAEKRTREQKTYLRNYFLTRDAPPNYRTLWAELNQLKEQKSRLTETIPTVMVMEEMAKPRETFVLGRGDYRNKGEKVTPGVPSIFAGLPGGAPQNRLGLAEWLVSPSHPLTARVAVNRYWQMYFGTGLVKTAEDFGLQGEAPSHPELLDWLATEFIRTGWDIRAMQRLIVTSATYRQASRVTPALVERDPENRLLARGPRFRLPAEIVRDNALAISGLLNPELGGPGVFPYQPSGVWEDIAYGDIFSAQKYTPSSGKDLYRRSMYTFWKRTAPPPSLATFDAPDREKCTARRPMTNTPLQALVLMNDPTFVEAARELAQRVIREAGPSVSRRIGLAFQLTTARPPATKELRLLSALARTQLSHYRKDSGAAQGLLAVGASRPDSRIDPAELAAWTTVASAILNLDEAITKE
jgi:hypothetical protein